jgi:tripartite-type tricarboxylate transporter receptor subunit TctC
MRESGIENVAYNSWAAVFAPKNTPREIVNSLSRDIIAILNEPGMRESLLKDGLLVAPLGPDELGTMTRRDSAVWAKVIKTAGIQPE